MSSKSTAAPEAAAAVAEAVRAALIAAAREAYESAGISGLCAEGRWENAIGAMQSLNLTSLLAKREAK